MNLKSIAPEKKSQRYGFIDALRGFAILGVLLVHTSQWVPPFSPINQVIAENGARGVQLFYIASALTIFMSMKSKAGRERRPILNFFIRRFFRIAPLFYLAIVVYTLIFGFIGRDWTLDGTLPGWYLLITALFLHGWLPETINSVVPGGWSIAVEMTFYLSVPFLYRRVRDYKDALLFILIALIGSALANWLLIGLVYLPAYPASSPVLIDVFRTYWFFSQLPVFSVGILVFIIFDRCREVRDRRLGMILLLIAFYLFFALMRVSTVGNLLPQQFLYGVAFGFLTLGLHFANPPLLVNPLTQWIGKLSFSIYLVHFAVLELIKRIIFPNGFPLAGGMGTLAVYLLVLVLSISISILTYRFVEQPGIRLGKQIITRLEAKQQAKQEAPAS